MKKETRGSTVPPYRVEKQLRGQQRGTGWHEKLEWGRDRRSPREHNLPMRNEDARLRPIDQRSVNLPHQFRFRINIERTGSLIEEQNPRILQQ